MRYSCEGFRFVGGWSFRGVFKAYGLRWRGYLGLLGFVKGVLGFVSGVLGFVKGVLGFVSGV